MNGPSLRSGSKRLLEQVFGAMGRRFGKTGRALREQVDVLAAEDAPRLPLQLRVEVTNLCNANCVFCIYQFQQREIETMGFDLFKRAVDQYTALGGSEVSFTPVVGDSLIDRNLEEKVAYVRQSPQYQRIEIWTNAILLTRKRFESLVEAGITEFNVSMSGFNAAEYEQLYRNKNYKKIIRNLTDIAQSDLIRSVKFVIWARTGLPMPQEEPDFIRLRSTGVLGIMFQREMFSWHGQIGEADLPGAMYLREPPREQRKPCLHLYAGFTLMSNGEMTVCGCTDMDGVGLGLGNIRDAPIDAHLKDGRWLKLRNAFLAGDPPTFCKGCDMYCPVDDAVARVDETGGTVSELLDATG